MAAFKQRELLRAGTRAPSFPVIRMEGGAARGTLELSQLWSKAPALLAFFKASCPVCQMTLPFLERIHRQAKPGAVEIYGVSQDDPATAADFVKEFGIGFPMLLDTEESGYPASNAYGLSHVPSLFLVEPGGAIGWSLEGFVKREFADMARAAGVAEVFHPGEKVPDWKAG